MKRHIICDTRFLEYQVEVDSENNWSDIYPDAVKEIPHAMPYQKDKPAKINTFVDEDHENDLETRQYITGVLIFINKTQSNSTSGGRILQKPQPTDQTWWP